MMSYVEMDDLLEDGVFLLCKKKKLKTDSLSRIGRFSNYVKINVIINILAFW